MLLTTVHPNLRHDATMAAAGPFTLAQVFLAFLSFCFAFAANRYMARSGIHDSQTAVAQSPIGMMWASKAGSAPALAFSSARV